MCASSPWPLCSHRLAAWDGSLLEFRRAPLPHSVPQAGGLGPEARACLPGQGLRYLEHLCLVLEQMARLQQLYLQLQTQRPPRVSEPQDRRASGGQVSGGGRGGLGPLEPALESGLECPSVLCTGS